MTFQVGSLVRARGREWVVLPESVGDFLMLRPLGGSDVEITGIAPDLEEVRPATFALPTPEEIGDHATSRLLHEALRLTVRSSAGPFRSFGRIAVEPRPYQLVPLLMALRLDPIRLLIADDVGIGKTVEAALIARELLDRGEVTRMTVLCPPHLAGQWHAELLDKFHLDAELVLASTAAKLERGLPYGVSLFERYDVTIVSTDFIRSDRRRDDFIRAAPELIIVDEAHTCADANAFRGSRHLKYQLIRGLANDPDRHMVFVTATPHSGSTTAFRELLGFLDSSFRSLPDDVTTEQQAVERRRLAAYLVQRRRADIRSFLDAETPFPDRLTTEITYRLTPAYRAFFTKVLAFARETVRDPAGGDKRRQRVQWWSALALLRTIGSSPAAAAETLRSRAAPADAATLDEANEVGARTVLDDDEESAEGADVTPGSDMGDGTDAATNLRRRLLALAREAEGLSGKEDAKLTGGIEIVRGLLKDGRNPIVFCRFIRTAEYVRDHLREAVGKDAFVDAITGRLPGDERQARVADLATKARDGQRVVLVATDCLSEGINLQETFDSMVHYDLSWNPTRHEQREGRVDRFLQPKPTVAVVTYYGENNPIDGLVLRVLLRKHQQIRDALGVSVPVPGDANAVQEALLEGLLLNRSADDAALEQLAIFSEEYLEPQTTKFHAEWENAAERERRSRTIFAQATIRPEEVAKELAAARVAIGRGVEVQRFVTDVLTRNGATVGGSNGLSTFDLAEVPLSVRDVAGLGERKRLVARFDPPRRDTEEVLGRTHPIVDGLASWVADTTLDPQVPPRQRPAARCGVIRAAGLQRVTTALLVRARYDISTRRGSPLLAEEVRVVAFAGSLDDPTWLEEADAQALLGLEPSGNVLPEDRARRVSQVTDVYELLRPRLEARAATWVDELADAHQRVRRAARQSGTTRVQVQLPLDILGVYVFLPGAT